MIIVFKPRLEVMHEYYLLYINRLPGAENIKKRDCRRTATSNKEKLVLGYEYIYVSDGKITNTLNH